MKCWHCGWPMRLHRRNRLVVWREHWWFKIRNRAKNYGMGAQMLSSVLDKDFS